MKKNDSLNDDLIKITNMKRINPIDDIISEKLRRNQMIFNDIQRSKDAEKQEELRRHNEMVEALKNGSGIIIGNNASGIQIQQSVQNSVQTMSNLNSFDYDKVKSLLNQIKDISDSKHFESTFVDNSDNIKKIVEETLEMVQNEAEPSLIQDQIRLMRDLVVGASGSIIATGILGILQSIPCF